MPKFYLLSILNRQRSFQSSDRSPFWKRIALAPATLQVLVLTAMVVVGISYILAVNTNATVGFDLKDLENQRDQLQRENQDLELQATQFQSLSVISEAAKKSQMVEVDRVQYLPSVGSGVAFGH